MQETLALLRDIHAPDAPSIWPLALGWWLVILFIIGIVATVFFYLRRQRTVTKTHAINTPVYDASAAFVAIVEQYQQDSNQQQLLQSVSMLLRKANIAHNSANHSLTGALWLAELDKQYRTDKFSSDYAALLQQQQYAKQNDYNAAAFIAFIESCLNKTLHNNLQSNCSEGASHA